MNKKNYEFQAEVGKILNIVANQFVKDRRGFIIAVSSVSGIRGRAKNYIYGSSKAALTTYMSGLRNRLDEYNVNVLTVISGYLSTINNSGLDRPNFLTSSLNSSRNGSTRPMRISSGNPPTLW